MATLFELLFGLGIFLYGMFQLEMGAKDLSGRGLRTWLLRSTQNPFASALSGTAITALLQSSSIVGLIVLAFASAGVIPLYNAVGVMLGANLGTTLTGWLVTILGFKLDLNHWALPFIAVGGMAQVVLSRHIKSKAFGQVLLGLGLVLFGLSIMKESVADVPNLVALESLQNRHAVVYLLFGIAITAVIQSSSATMMLTLAALNAQLIALPDAAALVIGADLGTTSTVVLGSLTGNIIKKQLAFAHFFFNFVVDIAAFFALLPLLPQLLQLLNIDDPLFSLVAFHSTFNLLGLMAFTPFLKIFSQWIEKIIKSPSQQIQLHKIPTAVPEAALPALMETIKQLWITVIVSNLSHFQIKPEDLDINEECRRQLQLADEQDGDFRDNYETIKRQEGEILQFALRLQQNPLTPEQTKTIIQGIDTTRSIVYGCKTLKDIAHNLVSLQHDSDKHARNQFVQQRNYQLVFYSQLVNFLLLEHPDSYLQEEYLLLLSQNDSHHEAMDKLIYEYTAAQSKVDIPASLRASEASEISSQLNVNREIHHATKNILRGLQHWLAIQV